MKKMIYMLLACVLLLSGMACAEGELPVLAAQLGKAAEMVEQTAEGDEYMEVLAVGEASVIIGRYAGELSAEELGAKFSDDLRDGELLIEGEGGVDQRAMFYTDNGGVDDVMDVTVIWLDGYTYGFVCVVSSDSYFGEEAMQGQIDFWVSTLEVFDGEFGSDPMSDVSLMLLYESPLYDNAELVESDVIGEDGYYLELAADAGAVLIGEYTLPAIGETADMDVALLGVARTIHPDAAEFAWTLDEEMTLQLEYPAYDCRWQTGANEDAREVRAYVIAGEQTLALSVAVHIDAAEAYAAQIDELFDSMTLYASGVDSEGPYMVAEEIAFALLGDYVDYWYAWDETIEEEEYWVYEFVDVNDEFIGAVAVQEETGAAYISFGTDALTAEFEPVLWDEAQGYHVADSVG